MQYVLVNSVDGEDFSDYVIGKIYINKQGRVICDPPNDARLLHIATKRVRRWPYEAGHLDNEYISVGPDEPEVFLKSIGHAYQNAYLRVGAVKND